MTKSTIFIFAAMLLLVGGCARESGKDGDSAPGGAQSSLETGTRLAGRAGEASITVFPTVVRTRGATQYSMVSAKALREFLEEKDIAVATVTNQQVDLSASMAPAQHDLFKNSMSLLSAHQRRNPVETDYVLLVEILVSPTPRGGEFVGGIQCYVLGADGQDAGSFLLNSHHAEFVEAQLKSEGPPEKTRDDLIEDSTAIVIDTLAAQLGT